MAIGVEQQDATRENLSAYFSMEPHGEHVLINARTNPNTHQIAPFLEWFMEVSDLMNKQATKDGRPIFQKRSIILQIEPDFHFAPNPAFEMAATGMMAKANDIYNSRLSKVVAVVPQIQDAQMIRKIFEGLKKIPVIGFDIPLKGSLEEAEVYLQPEP